MSIGLSKPIDTVGNMQEDPLHLLCTADK